MKTTYIGSMPADLNNQSTVRTVELRVEDSEAFPGYLALGVYNYKTGGEFVLAYLKTTQVGELREALTTFLEEAHS